MVSLLAAGESSISSFAKVVSYLGAVILVLLLAYWGTRFLSHLNFNNVKNKHIKFVDKFFISGDRSIFLLKVGNRFYLIASDKTGLKSLDVLNKEDLGTYMDEEEFKKSWGKEGLDSPLVSFAEKLKLKQRK